MELQKGKLYTLVGIDGVSISRTDGVKIKLDNESLENVSFDVDTTDGIINDIASDIDMYVERGFNAVLTLEQEPDGLIATDYEQVVSYEDYDDDNDYDGDEDLEEYALEETEDPDLLEENE